MKRKYTVDEIKSIAGEIAKRHGVERMFLFGSYARGEAKIDSDLDFRIDKGRIRGLFALGGLYADLEEAFGLSVDLLTTESLDEAFRSEISSEEVLIYEQN
ncbi:MAG: nucleotidyltransferase domain-containing protein [Clostridiaceae bacterium]|nr:nucleotidyltransferase domain-containing protein [Clostridiaceae bacterium]